MLVTHVHWDHVSGLDDLQVPIWMNSGERRYAAEDPGGKVFRTVSAGHEIHEYGFNGPPYLGFPSSFDVHGDGSVVIALAAGHTTGSVVVFVTVPSGNRYAFIGDLTWQLDGIRRRVERPTTLTTSVAFDGLIGTVTARHAELSARPQLPIRSPEWHASA